MDSMAGQIGCHTSMRGHWSPAVPAGAKEPLHHALLAKSPNPPLVPAVVVYISLPASRMVGPLFLILFDDSLHPQTLGTSAPAHAPV
jgi:hypothetical protein